MPAVILNKGQQVFMTAASSSDSTTSNAEMQYTDQATQVDFPIAATFPRHRKRMMQRYNTTIDGFPGAGGGLIAQNGSCIKLGHSTARQSPYHRQDRQYQHQNQTRPKSLILSNASGGTTPDASSLHSVDSNPSQRGAASVYSSDFALSTSERTKKWNTPIAAYNFGKVWKSSSTGGLKSSGYDSSTMSLGGGRVGGCGCQCNCNNIPMRTGKLNMAPFSTGIGVPGGDATPDGLPGAEGLSWRRLHMSRAKLKATATTSELLSGFAMVAMVELQINEPTQVPEWLFVMFSVCTTVLVAVHIFALMISTYLLPNIDAISKLEVASLVSESPHERMRGFIELAWAFSTVFGLFLFLVEVAILCWVKFWDYSFVAAMAATVIVIPVLIIFVAFAVHFYHSLVIHKCEVSSVDMQQLEDMKKKLDNVASPV